MPRTRLSPIPGERDLIESLRKKVGSRSSQAIDPQRLPKSYSDSNGLADVRLGIGDDCAILRPPRGHEILVTTDFSLETIHFRRDWHPAESVGHRCLARGLSDLAAMGAQPLAVFLSLALPVELVRSRGGRPSWRDRFLAGFLALAGKFGVPLAGGDTAVSPLNPGGDRQVTGWALADIVLVGSAPRNRALLRSGAKAGDRIYVTGQLGGAAAELARLAVNPRRFRSNTKAPEDGDDASPHLYPEPRITVGAWLLKNRRATAAIDISDGLSTDLDHLCEESGLSATIDAAALPIGLRASSLKMALNGGEDYELLFTASPDARIPRQIRGVPITCIGTMHANSSSTRLHLKEEVTGRSRTRPMAAVGWEHYRT